MLSRYCYYVLPESEMFQTHFSGVNPKQYSEMVHVHKKCLPGVHMLLTADNFIIILLSVSPPQTSLLFPSTTPCRYP